MVVPTDPALLVLHTLRLKSFVDADVVANAARLADSVAAQALEQLNADGFVSYRNGRISGWSLTTAGRIEGERRLAEELDATGSRAVVTAAYQRFVALNRQFLGACTRWQLRAEDGTHFVNDHSDASYDASVVAELDEIDDAVQPICQELAAASPRFGYYNGRFAAARVRVHAGEHDWFTKPVIDSYHTVWFELHENLLATLNLERADESQ
jgi:hypothetical protein